jgi:regulatory protein
MKVATDVAKLKIEAFCAYQDRSSFDVRLKLKEWEISEDQVNLIMQGLVIDGFLNDQRFASSFVSGKFRIKKWGRIKIKAQLRLKKISSELIAVALKEIESEQYWQTLLHLTEKKSKELASKNDSQWNKRIKIARFLTQKGYESDLISDALDQILSE